jgi:predicted RNA-binding protein YlxR (DUF448 family)
VLTADGRAVVDRTGPGRGAWLCDPPGECFRLAVRRRSFERAWRRPVSAESLAHLEVLLAVTRREVGRAPIQRVGGELGGERSEPVEKG